MQLPFCEGCGQIVVRGALVPVNEWIEASAHSTPSKGTSQEIRTCLCATFTQRGLAVATKGALRRAS